MADGEINDKFDRVLDHLASLAVKVERLAESQAKTDQLVNRLAAVTLEGFKDVNAKIDALLDAQMRTEEHLRKTDENLKKTDENLRNLTAVVDRYFKGLNGKT